MYSDEFSLKHALRSPVFNAQLRMHTI